MRYSYASAFVGSYAFMAFALFAYQVGKPTDRTASYYRSRMSFYGSGLALAGFSQLLLGAYVLSKFGGGGLVPAVRVAMYTVSFPEISITVGLIQLLMGIWGILRRFGILIQGPNNHIYQICAFFMWIFMLSMQVVTQVGFQPAGMFAPAAPSYACLYLGISIMSPYLDYKMRTTPEELPIDYYGINVDEAAAGEQEKALQEEDVEIGGADEMYDDDISADA